MLEYKSFFASYCRVFLRIVSFLLFCMFSSMVYGATGTVTFSSPATGQTFYTQSNFTVKGSYLMTEDSTPTGITTDSACINPYNPSGEVQFAPGYWDTTWWLGTNAEVWYSIDGKGIGNYPIGSVGFTRGIAGRSDIGVAKNFSAFVNVQGMQPSSTHTMTVSMIDVYSMNCKYMGGYWSFMAGFYRGGVFATKTFNFTISNPKPTISIALTKPSITGCESETGSVTVTSNDPTPNGGTVTLTFPDGTTAAAAFAGKTATLTFADFGLPNGYSGVHKAGDILNFTASVTTAAGHTALSTATANVIAGGLNVTITPAKTAVEPKLRPRADVKPSQAKTAYTTPVEVYVTDIFNQPVSGASVSLQVETADAGFGGHDHGNWLPPKLITPKPTGTLSPASGTTLTGFMNTVYTSSELSSLERIKATVAYQGCSVAAIPSNITTQISGLSNLVVNSPHQKIGGTDAHHGNNWNGFPTTPDNNHWVSASTSVRMGLIMSDYATNFKGAGLYINDASLPKGGKFDIKADWIGKKHQTHRRGIDVDVHTSDTSLIPNIVKVRLEELKRKVDKDLFNRVKDEGNHLHIYFQPN